MATLIREGGWPIWFTLLFGVITLVGAARFAVTARRKHLGFVIGMAFATLFSVLNGVAADLAAVGHSTNRNWDEWSPQITRILAQGFAESMSPAILGFTILSLGGLITAVGLARTAKTEA
jgi:Na+/H+ antiporter NhaC